MKKLIVSAVFTTVTLITSYVLATETHHPEEKPAPSAPATGEQDMEKHMDQMREHRQEMQKQMKKHMGQMHEHVREMQKQMEKIHQTKDPKERQKLLQEHMQSMLEGWKTMHGMAGPMTVTEETMERRMDRMEQRLHLMEVMMEQMLRHQEATQAPLGFQDK